MPWARLDDGFITNGKIASVGKDAKLLWLWSIGYSARELTDGFIRTSVVSMLGAMVEADDVSQAKEELLREGLWEETNGGFLVHDYLEYNPTKDEVIKTREVRAEAGRLGGLHSGETRRSKTEANTEANASQLSKQNGSKTEAKTNPVPGPVPGPGPLEIQTSPVEINNKAPHAAGAAFLAPETDGQKLFCTKFGRKRFATHDQKAAIAEIEKRDGLDALEKALVWAAENNVRNMSSIRTRAHNIATGSSPPRASPGSNGKASNYEESMANAKAAIEKVYSGGTYFGPDTS